MSHRMKKYFSIRISRAIRSGYYGGGIGLAYGIAIGQPIIGAAVLGSASSLGTYFFYKHDKKRKR